ncbi:MAG TPA: hypothetical protein PLV25_06490 [Opitutales bacterium]|nr:hypothetical protein [Opitutales bacterium]
MVISPSTWKRWRRWWRASFTTSHFWIQAQGIISPAHLNGPFPGKLLSLFIGHLEERLVSLLKFLTPMTVRVLQSI